MSAGASKKAGAGASECGSVRGQRIYSGAGADKRVHEFTETDHSLSHKALSYHLDIYLSVCLFFGVMI